jgi:propanol-preferring alcohol dehydrogenase
MQAMVLQAKGRTLCQCEIPTPTPGENELLLKVLVCGVCRTDLHVVDRELSSAKIPLVPGHEIVARVEKVGAGVTSFSAGQRVGVSWLARTCGHCRYCLNGQENLCDNAIFTGYQCDGGYAEYTVADARYCFALPDLYSDAQIAPLLCAGLIGWRSLKLAGSGSRVGIYGFGAAAHIITQIVVKQGRHVFAFTRPGDADGQRFALSLGATWAGGSEQSPPESLDAAIIFAPVGALIPTALTAVAKGGLVVSGGIHMSDIPSFPYEILWGERAVRSVANLTRQDAIEFLSLASNFKIKTQVRQYPLQQANEALEDLRQGRIKGAAVLVVDQS